MNRGGSLRVAICTSLCAHGTLCLWTRTTEPPGKPPVRTEIEISLADERTEPPPPLPEQSTLPPRPRARGATPRPRKPPANAPPLAAAEPALAQDDGPVDLTSETFITGTGTAPAAATAGRSASAVPTREVGTQLAARDASSAVSLESHAWSCPWPAEADAANIDEQTVVLRVVVYPSGNAASATLVSDPGHGFGTAALSCALRTRFTPARDPTGSPVRAQSPPIRVTFRR